MPKCPLSRSIINNKLIFLLNISVFYQIAAAIKNITLCDKTTRSAQYFNIMSIISCYV